MAVMRKHETALSASLKQEFRKDLELFKYFLLLLNNSSPIRNVELMWVDDLEPSKSVHKERVNTGDALVQLQVNGGASSNRNSPSTLFCDLVSGFGFHEEGTCARSDVPAKQRCQATGRSQVYWCHVGLRDIAVPVICDGKYLGTLFSGQVLSHPPTAEGFEQVRTLLAGQPHIDFAQLEAAYYQVPVVNEAQLAEMVRILELFARYISNSWKRLEIMGDLQRVRDRELALDRKELAAILLSGEISNGRDLESLAARVGLQELPNTVLVMRMTRGADAAEVRPQIADNITMSRMMHVVEDLCQNRGNTLAISARPGEICICTQQEARNSQHGRSSLQVLADSILTAARAQGIGDARFGVSGLHARPEDLLRAYYQACAALEGSDLDICFFEESAATGRRPGPSLAPLVKAIQEGEKVDAAVRDLLARSMPPAGSVAYLPQARAFLTWASEHLALEMISVGTDPLTVNTKKDQAIGAILEAPNPLALGEAFRQFAEFLTAQVAWTFSQRESKIILAVHQLVERRGAAKLTIQEIASALKMSSGHLSRVYSRTTGMTLEVYLIRQRVELAKRMLLDPRLNIAEVADLCGFCNPAYFASVFKKYAHCTPRGFAAQPQVWKPFSLPAIKQGLNRFSYAGQSQRTVPEGA
jgi:AraC-like DNA-binding protein/ligand-binding sensor protein